MCDEEKRLVGAYGNKKRETLGYPKSEIKKWNPALRPPQSAQADVLEDLARC